MIQQFTEIVKSSPNIVFFGGAGVSTESGIPDFRSPDGLYHLQYQYPPEQILSHTFFSENPEEFFRFYRKKIIGFEASPNIAHKKLAELEQGGNLKAVVTQNIDGLHQAAGSKNVLELHGSTHKNHCLKCGRKYGLEDIKMKENVPHCICGGIIRPDVVLYEEPLNQTVVKSAVDYISKAHTLIVAGTSLNVYPAAGLIRYFSGEHLILINLTETAADESADIVIHEKIGKVFQNL